MPLFSAVILFTALFMELTMKKTLLNTLIVISISSLAACGGGESKSSPSSGNTGSGSGSSSDITYVDGEIKYSTDSEDNYLPPKAGAGNAETGANCANSTYYFESENVLVFGGEGYPDEDMIYAASLVENNLEDAFNKMGITKEEFNLARPLYIPSIALKITDLMAGGWSDETGARYDITNLSLEHPFNPEGWSEYSYDEKKALVYSYWNSLDRLGHYMIGVEYNKVSEIKISGINLGPGDYKVPDKLMVCLSDSQDKYQYGQGTLFGMVLARHSVHKRDNNDENQVVLHELIHTIQANVSSPLLGTSGRWDHWFKEGQATFLAGQTMAENKNGMRPVDVINYPYQSNVFKSTGDAYKHYALAYSKIHNKDTVKSFLYDFRQNSTPDNKLADDPFMSYDRFEWAFDKNMSVTLRDFRTNY